MSATETAVAGDCLAPPPLDSASHKLLQRRGKGRTHTTGRVLLCASIILSLCGCPSDPPPPPGVNPDNVTIKGIAPEPTPGYIWRLEIKMLDSETYEGPAETGEQEVGLNDLGEVAFHPDWHRYETDDTVEMVVGRRYRGVLIRVNLQTGEKEYFNNFSGDAIYEGENPLNLEPFTTPGINRGGF